MHFNLSITSLFAAGLAAFSVGCATDSNYLGTAGPRYAGDYAPSVEAEILMGSTFEMTAGPTDAPTYKVVSYNVRYGEKINDAIQVLTNTPELADADVFLLQEMNADGVDRIARELDCSYVYYPASLRTSGHGFGNAVLTRGRIADDQKVLLPHVNPYNRQSRIAVRAELELGQRALHAYSVHIETPFLSIEDRSEQVETLLGSVPEEQGPVLIAGDFNTMSRRSLQRFEEAFSELGFQNASTSIGSTFSFGPFDCAMDHVFVRDLEVVRAGKAEGADASDHAPIWIEFTWSGSPPSVLNPTSLQETQELVTR